jgi:hypothetical protein
VNAWIASSILVTRSWQGCGDANAINVYKAFFAELRLAGWSSFGLVRIATSLLAIRGRKGPKARAYAFDKKLAEVIAPSSLGWDASDYYIGQ